MLPTAQGPVLGRGDSQYPKYTWAREVPCPLWPLGLAYEATGVQVAQRCPQKLNKQAPHKETQPPCPRGRPHHPSDRGCARVQNTSCSVVKMTPYKAGRSSPTPGHAHACTHVHSHAHACALRAALPRARGGLEQGFSNGASFANCSSGVSIQGAAFRKLRCDEAAEGRALGMHEGERSAFRCL